MDSVRVIFLVWTSSKRNFEPPRNGFIGLVRSHRWYSSTVSMCRANSLRASGLSTDCELLQEVMYHFTLKIWSFDPPKFKLGGFLNHTPPVSYLAPEPLFGPTQFESAITRQHVGKREGTSTDVETTPAPRCLFCIRYQHLRRCLLLVLVLVLLLNSGAAGKACENSRGAGRCCGKQETWQ